MSARLKEYTPAILAVPCKLCGAQPIQRCVNSSGMHTGPHRQRKKLAGDSA